MTFKNDLEVNMKKWIFCAGGFCFLILLTGCGSSLQNLAEQILYPYQSTNSQFKTPTTPPSGLGEVTFDFKDQSNQPVHIVAWTYQPPNGSNKTVVYFHGNAENLDALWVSNFLTVMQEFKTNYIVIDYPSYGLSTGTPNQYTLVTAADKAIEWAKQTYPNNQIIVWGRSLGCGVATLATGQEQSLVSKLALTSAWTNFLAVAESVTSLASDLPQSWVSQNNYDSASVAPSIHLPVLMQHGTADTTIPFTFGQQLKTDFTSSPSVTFDAEQGLNHNNMFTSPTVWQQLNSFINGN